MYRSWWVFGMLHKDTRMASVFSIQLIVSWLMFIVGIFSIGILLFMVSRFLVPANKLPFTDHFSV